MLTKRIRNAAAYRRVRGLLLVGFAASCVVFVWRASAQDDTPPGPVHAFQTSQIAATPEVTADPRQIAVLTINPLNSQKIGRPVVATAKLVNQEGIPQTNKPLLIFVDGQQVRRDRTDQNGVSSISIRSGLSLGEHELRVQFIGTAAYYGVSATTTFKVVPLQLTLETVPPLAGIPISVEGQVLTTNRDGLAVVDIGSPGTVNLEVLQQPDGNIDENTRASFVRWSDDGFQPQRTFDLTNDNKLQIGFSISHPISHSFVDRDGNPVDYSKISGMRVRTSTGSLVSFDDNQPKWITSTEIARRRTGLEATNILYSVESVTIDGTNVVNRYQQHFLAEANTPWQIEVLLYSATVSANDALFGFPIGNGISLEYPDGHVKSLSFGANKSLSLDLMARGTYRIKVEGVQSLTGWTPIALSRDQTVQLQVFSYIDVAVLGALGVLIALTLLFYGRPFLMKLPLLVYRSLHRRPAIAHSVPGDEAESFNFTFFHSSAIDKGLSSSSTPGKMSHASREGNVIQISGRENIFTSPILINFPLGSLVCVANGSSKKGHLLIDLIHQWQTELARRSTANAATMSREDKRFSKPDSIFADICEIYASLPESRRNRYKPENFDYRSSRAQCKNCAGKGRFLGHADDEAYTICPVCQGKGYKLSILKVTLDDISIGDVLAMTVNEAAAFFIDYPTVADKLQSLQQLGFGELIVGEPGVVLSAKGILNIHEVRQNIDHHLYIFNTPLGRMSAVNAARQVTMLEELLDRESKIRIIEDNAVPRTIENPVIMLKLAADHTRGNADESAASDNGTQMLGMNG